MNECVRAKERDTQTHTKTWEKERKKEEKKNFGLHLMTMAIFFSIVPPLRFFFSFSHN